MHNIPISTGELLDRITILKLKTSANTTKNNINQLATLMQLWIDIPLEERLKVDELMHKLFEINKKLWNLEDLVRSTKDDVILLDSAKQIFESNIILAKYLKASIVDSTNEYTKSTAIKTVVSI